MSWCTLVGVKKEDLTGKRFGSLVVLSESPRYLSPKGESRVSWVCLCEKCGKTTTYRSTTLKFSGVKTCGCFNRKYEGQISKSGKSGTKVHRTWMGMRARCRNQRASKFMLYGGRGIKVCERWNSFNSFYEDMGDPPSPKHTLDRIDVNGDYEPGNCRWVLQKIQTRNQSRNVLINLSGKIQCVGAWSEELGIKQATIFNRIYRGETDPEKILRPVS